MARAQRAVAQSSGAMKRSVGDLQLSMREVATFSSRLFRTGALVFGGAFGAQKLLEIADAAKNLSAQLKLATSQYGSFAQANKDVQGIAERSRSDLLATAELYSALQRNSDQFGATQAQVARVTETVSKAFKISGSSADEAANATRQLVQAFQSGRLQGDEFRSMMENAPRLARLLADSLGKTVGQLRNMSKEGKLTADVLVKAFSDQKFTAAIDAEFKQLPVTFDQAMGQLYNAAVITFGAFDSGGQFSTALANFISGGTQGFASLEKAAYDFGAETRGVLDGLDAVRAGIASLHSEGISGLLDLTDATFSLRDAFVTVLSVVDGIANHLVDLFQAPANLGRLIAGSAPVFGTSNLAGSFGTAYDKAQTDATRRRIMGVSAADMLSEFGLSRRVPAFHPAGDGAKKGKKPPRDRSADVQYQFENEQRAAQREILQAQLALAVNTAERRKISFELLDLEKQQQNAELDEKVRKAQRDFAEHKITAGALAEVTAQAKTLRQKYDIVDELKREAGWREVAADMLKEEGQIEDARFDIARTQLQAEDDLATTALEHRDIQLRLLDLAYEQERAAQNRILADEQATDAVKEEARLRLAALDARYHVDRAGVMVATRGPLEQWAASIPQTAAQVNEALQSIETQGLDGLADAIAGVISGTESLKEAFGNLAQSIISDIIRMTVRMLIFRAISGLMGGGSGGTTSIIPLDGGVMSITDIPGRASGGPVTPGRTYLVGEQGPELLHMGGHGQVIPNSELGGGGGTITINQRYSFEGVAVTKDEFLQGLMFSKHDTIATLKDMNRRGRG